MTREQFIAKEVATWGEDYIFDLLDRGYEVVELHMGTQLKWTWLLTHAPEYGTVESGSGAGFTPVFPSTRAYRTNAT